MQVYKTTNGIVIVRDGQCYAARENNWDLFINRDHLHALLLEETAGQPALGGFDWLGQQQILAPVGNQEVWAAGVTYLRSKDARMEESKDAGGGSFYDRVYAAERPEIFFKATPQRVAHPGQAMHLRGDSKWMVPEPELTLAINSSGEIIGCTVGNDLSCRDIEGENPLYLPQAKCFKLCAALGPAVLIQSEPLAPTTRIHLQIDRAGAAAFEGETTLAQLKRTPAELAGFLFRDNTFPTGTFLMTGTGIVPGDEFTLKSGDVVKITIDGIGTLSNPMA